jgi:hypothetical protein
MGKYGWLVLSAVVLTACDAGKQDEIKLLSKDNTHMLYLYPTAQTAEIYSGISALGVFDVSQSKANTYVLSPTSGSYTQLELTFDPVSGNWSCKQCKKQGLTQEWTLY